MTLNVYDNVIKAPDKIITYFIHKYPDHRKYIPPKVTSTDTKGSTVKNNFTFLEIFVSHTNPPIKKNINDIDKI